MKIAEITGEEQFTPGDHLDGPASDIGKTVRRLRNSRVPLVKDPAQSKADMRAAAEVGQCLRPWPSPSVPRPNPLWLLLRQL
jgi:hypothetical protein